MNGRCIYAPVLGLWGAKYLVREGANDLGRGLGSAIFKDFVFA
jgi:hypothetical protein